MTAVTQCPQCGTRFRVVPDQLKISHGWVRCGKCAEVFNAREALETAAALKAGQPAPPHAGLAPQQVSIVLRQQEPASAATDADMPTGPDKRVDEPEVHDAATPLQPAPFVATCEPVWQSDDSSPPDDGGVHGPFQTGEPVAVAPPDVALADLPAWLIKPVASDTPVAVEPVAEPAKEPPTQTAAPAVALAVAVSALQQTVAHWVRTEEPEPEPVRAEPGEATSDALPVAADVTFDTCAESTEMPAPDVVEPMDVDLPMDSVPLGAPATLSVAVLPDVTVVVDALVPPSDTPGRARAPEGEVGFIRQARRQAAWASGPARAALGALVLFASALLALQVSVHERDRLAAMVPALKPWLIQLCEPVGCEIGSFHHIEAVEIVSTELVRAKDGTYRFEMGLRNNAVLPVAMPAVELSLTDRNGEAVVRRVVLPDDWVTAPAELPPVSETSLTLKMSLVNPDELRMEGFRAVVFYP